MTAKGNDRRALATTLALAAAATLAATATACYDDVKVVQGTVTQVEAAASTIAVKDERAPNATVSYRLTEPATVATGDLVRVAFRDGADGKQVVRLMNLTRHRAKDRRDKK
ncbi:MAG: hypothetical protein HY906_08510 [Deltaproteobacteria bacterium]|nr:hypothetical protein [Deltaproteobacteria bacterium]